MQQAKVIKNYLDRFCRASGQKVSCQKSRVQFTPNTSEASANLICQELHIQMTPDLGFYLGMPTINGRVTRTTFQHIIEKFDKRLAGWKSHCLSLAGRVTLTKSVLSTLPLYWMQTAKVSPIVCDDFDGKIRKFVWEGDDEYDQIHLVNWEMLQKDKADRGLGIKSMRQANAAFLTKLGWRLLSEPNSLWSRVIRHKYCKGRCDLDMFLSNPRASNVWQGILANKENIRRGVSLSLGNGKKTLFWHHN